MLKATKTMWPWALGLALGLVAGMFHVALLPAGAGDEDVAVYEVDFSKELTASDLQELIRFHKENPDVDLILKPAPGFQPMAGDERRAQDQLRAAREDQQMQEKLAQGYADGVYVDATAEPPACLSQVMSWKAMEPGRQLLCDSNLVSAPSRVPFRRAVSAADLEDLLRERLYDLLEGVTAEEEALGFYSHFSNGAALQSLRIDADGAVVVDFNDVIKSQLGHLNPGYASHTMLQQVFRTLFQFRDVSAVQLTLNGSCEAFGDMIGGPCQDLDRDLWELMSRENQEMVKFFKLEGVR